MGRLVAFAAFVLSFAFAAAAAVDVGPSRVEIAPAGDCPRTTTRCVAAAGDANAQVLLWLEEAAPSGSRLLAESGGLRTELFRGRRLDQPAAATDGESFVAVWESLDAGVFALAGAQVLADGSVAGRWTFGRWDLLSDPGAGVVWTGLEYAVAVPEEVFFIRDGGFRRRVRLTSGYAHPNQKGSLPAFNANSLLVVRATARYYLGNLPTMAPTIIVPTLSTNVVGSSSGRMRELMAPDPASHAFSLAAGGDGYLLVWKDDGNVRALRLDQNGGAVGSGEAVTRPVRSGGVTAVAPTRSGWLVLWDDGSDSSPVIRAIEVDANGRDTRGPAVTLATDGRSPAIVKLGEDRFRVFYRRGSSIESRLVATGSETVPGRRRAVR